ncbi:hypothetical protein MHZ95_00725 [Sporosarcina sp. ACRSM]|uniref:hypothetical protein n=1 Tax=Sporosarcina sp. ACRSM TaxID=2918216 RepID=UPI001EF6CF17|nr:hypothetical protein [Sporosarcina sp. ACRSM]MCG7333793.1 hypothetical protein [Sporosarcina sp. ACRSM]
MTWFWVNTYSDDQLKTLKQEAKDHDWSSTFIRENEALGFSTNSPVFSTLKLDNEYEDILYFLQTSFFHDTRTPMIL